MFNLKKDSIVYIVAPPFTSSGGPELLHQLGYVLKQMKINAKIFYYDKNHPKKVYDDPVPPRYICYGVERALEIKDSADNLLIVPETITAPLKNYSNIQKCVWWLGIKNYFWFKESSSDYFISTLYHWFRYIFHLPAQLKFSEIKKLNISHLAQCWYAKNFLEEKGISSVEYLSDYINQDFIKYCDEKKEGIRKDIILYNPKRVQKLIKPLQRKDPSLKFIPIQKMSQNEMREIMSSAKLYVDFGAHPGKDRMPREAALCGCCVITSTLGSAGFSEDIPIMDEFKFDRKKKNVLPILDKIHYVLNNYENEAKKFDAYREFIKNEYQVFLSDVNKLFHIKEEESSESSNID